MSETENPNRRTEFYKDCPVCFINIQVQPAAYSFACSACGAELCCELRVTVAGQQRRTRAAYRRARELGVIIVRGRGRHEGNYSVGHEACSTLEEVEELLDSIAERAAKTAA
jgi:hypothetical protein